MLPAIGSMVLVTWGGAARGRAVPVLKHSVHEKGSYLLVDSPNGAYWVNTWYEPTAEELASLAG